MKLRILTLIVICISTIGFSQRTKTEGVYAKEWHLPKIVLGNEYQTFTINYLEKNKDINLNLFSKKEFFKSKKDDKKENTLDLYKRIRLSNFKYVEGEADLQINILKNQVILELSTVEVKKSLTDKSEIKKFVGKMKSFHIITVSVTDKNDKVLFSNTKKYNSVLHTTKTCLTETEAKELLLKKYSFKTKEHIGSALSNLVINLYYSAIELRKGIDYYIASNRLNAFLIKKAKKDDGTEEINANTSKLIKFLKNDSLEGVEGVLNFYEKVLPNYNGSKKENLKIRWTLLSNLSICYYVKENYTKALEIIKKRKETKYKKGYTFNEEVIQHKVNGLAKHFKESKPIRDFKKNDYTFDVENLDFTDSHNNNNTIVKAYLNLHFLNKITNLKDAVVRPESYHNHIFGLIKRNKKYPRSYASKDKVKEMQTYMKKNDSKEYIEQRTLFFKKYPILEINKSITLPSIEGLYKKLNFTDNEKIIVNDLLEVRANIFLDYMTESNNSNSNLLITNIKNNELSKYRNIFKNVGDNTIHFIEKSNRKEKIKEQSEKEFFKGLRTIDYYISSLSN